ncbi:MAG: hypothetical protein U0703_13805 [Anaerolineae bacterium]
MSENLPDFDSMSQDEIMAWMETLAKRQGASEGFTTAADMDIAEVDPSTAVIDEPGYVPYGQEADLPPKPAPAAPPVQPAAQAAPPPAASAPPPAAPKPPMPGVTSTLAWLESLAADKDEGLFNLDLSDQPSAPAAPPKPAPVVQPVAQAAPPPAPVAPEPVVPVEVPVNTMDWLEELARSQVAEQSLEHLGADDDRVSESEKLDPFAQGVNPMEWLETLARRQGAKDEELTTNAQMNIPEPADAEVEQEDYQPFSFDTLPTRRGGDTAPLENPAEWLGSLAGGEGYSEEGVLATQKPTEAEPDMSLDAIQDAITAGTVTREQMQYFLDQQADQIAEESEEAGVYDDDMPIVPAELPDWLSEMRPPEVETAPSKPLDALFEAPPAEVAMPDWLRPEAEEEQSSDLESIFAAEDESAPVVMQQPAAEVQVDPNDPWTEAFDVEYEQGGEADISRVPDWYDQNVHDPARIAAVEDSAAQLADAGLPEEKDLAAGQPQPVPTWMGGPEPSPEPEEAVEAFRRCAGLAGEVEASVTPEEVPGGWSRRSPRRKNPSSSRPPQSRCRQRLSRRLSSSRHPRPSASPAMKRRRCWSARATASAAAISKARWRITNR